MYRVSNKFLNSFLLIFSIFILQQAVSQESMMVDMTNTITEQELKEYVYTLAADSMEGRFTGTAGQRLAAAYIADHFRQAGVFSFDSIGSYRQTFNMEHCSWMVAEISQRQKLFFFPEDFMVLDDPPTGGGVAEVVFGGYGLEHEAYSDLQGLDVKGKIVVAFSGEPKNSEGVYRISGRDESSRESRYYMKFRKAKEMGARGMIIVSTKKRDFKKYRQRLLESQERRNLNYPGDRDTSSFFGLYTTLETAALLLDVDDRELLQSIGQIEKQGTAELLGKSETVRFNFRRQCRDVPTENIIGYTKGRGNSDEWVVVVAHYDHLGMDGKKVYNGADDNGSGTAAVMELAEAFSMASANGFRPMRNVAFLLVSAEEIGLYGSRYFVENPLFPIEDIYAVVNIDMIGRVGSRYGEEPGYIGGWGYVSPEIVEVAEDNMSLMAPDIKFRMKYSERRGGGSDHYYFVRNDIPALFYFTGIHDDYHDTGDTPEKLLYDRMEKTVRGIFSTVWVLANREEGLKPAE
jgi:hypothetical protein